VVPTVKGPITGSVYGLSRLVAESPAFQRRVEASDRAEAEKHVKRWLYTDHPTLVKAARPFAAIWPATDFDLEQFAGGASIRLMGSGALVLILTDRDRWPKAARQDSGDDFAGWVDEVITEIKNQSGVDDRLCIRRISFLRPLMHSDDWDAPSAGAYWDVWFLVEWK